MILCLCENISDRVIRREIDDGARTVREVRERCGAGGNCGSCVCDVKRMLQSTRERADMVLPVAAK